MKYQTFLGLAQHLENIVIVLTQSSRQYSDQDFQQRVAVVSGETLTSCDT